MIKVFISGPYTNGGVDVNLDIQIDVANELLDLGFNALIPNLCYHPIQSKHPRKRYSDWFEITLDWIESCDYLLRLPGESYGADLEVKKAKELGKPVFYSIYEITEYNITAI